MPPDKLKQIIRENVRARRLEVPMTQAQLGEKVGSTQAAIAQIERGSTSLSVEFLARIAEALDVQPSMLLIEHAFTAAETAA